MKKSISLLLCLSLLLGSMLYVSPLSIGVQATESLEEDDTMLIIENADFETTAEDSTPGWALLSGVIMPSGELAITDAQARTGNHSLSITPISTFTDTKTSVVYSSVILGIRDGYSYTAGAYFKGDIVPSISIRFYNMYSVEVTSAAVKTTGEATDDWTRLEVTGTVPSGVLFVRVLVEGYGEGTLYVDDVDIVENPIPEGQSKPVAYGTQVPDGSFEKAAAGDETPWVLEQSGSGKWVATVSSDKGTMENYVSGDITAMRFTSYDPVNTTAYFYTAAIPVTPGETYSYSMNMRTSKTDHGVGQTFMRFYTSDGSPTTAGIVASSTSTLFANINWREQKGSYTAPAGATHLRIGVYLTKQSKWDTAAWGTSRWVDIDDFVVSDSNGAVFTDDFTQPVTGTKSALTAANTTTTFVTDGSVGVKMGAGKLVSGNIPVLQGKEYTSLIDVNCGVVNSVAFIVEYFNKSGTWLKTFTTANTSSGVKETLTLTQIAPDNAVYAKISVLVTTGISYLDNVRLYAVTDSISNFSFEQVNAYAGSGNFPMQWRTEGDVDAWSVSSPKNDMPNRTMGLQVTGNGSVYSSMMRATAGNAYLARIQASSVVGGGFRLAFFNEKFEKLSSSELTAFTGKEWTRYTAVGTAPANAAYVAFELVAAVGDNYRVDMCEFSDAVLNIADNTQMFLDDYVLASTSGLTRTFHEGQKSDAVLDKSTGDPWEKNGSYLYGSVLFDEEEQIFKMWYTGLNVYDASHYDGFQLHTCYATSPDGINWTRPNLGIVDYGGNTNNNIIGVQQLASVIKQSKEDEPDDAKRYVMIYQDYEIAIKYQGSKPSYTYAYSADGIHWGEGTAFTPGWDVISAVWDDDEKNFITLQKVNIHGRRDQHFMTGTPDEWSVPLDAAALADIQDTLETYRADTYGTSFYVKDGNYIALEWLLKAPGFADTNVTHMMDGTVDLRLGYSRDLTEDWQRPQLGAIVPHGEEGERDRCMYTAAYAIDVGDEIWLYTGGSDQDHGGKLVWDSVNQQWTTYIGGCSREIFITKWRADGFASMNAGDNTGVMTTKPLLFSGDKLILNANAEGGAIRVELLDANGNVLEGYSQNDCDVITTDSVRHVVSWNGNADLSNLEGEAVTVKIYAENSEIYSFKFSDTIPGSNKPVKPEEEKVVEYEAKEMVSISTNGYVRFAEKATDYKLFMASEGAHYDNTYASNSTDAFIHRYVAPSDGILIIDTAYTSTGDKNYMGIQSGSEDWHSAHPAKYAIVDNSGKIVFPRNGEFGTVSYGNPAGIPASDPVRIEVKAGDHVDFILMDTYGGQIPMFFRARVFMNSVSEANYVGGPNGLLTGKNFNQQGEGGWYYMYADAMTLVNRVVGDVNGDGALNANDATALINRILGKENDETYTYDVNRDGKVDIRDLANLKLKLSKLAKS